VTSAASFPLPASGFRLPASGFRLPASGFRLPVYSRKRIWRQHADMHDPKGSGSGELIADR
jgi:hypothetical protein